MQRLDRLWVRIALAIAVIFGITLLVVEIGMLFHRNVLESGETPEQQALEDLCEEEEGQVIDTILVASVFFTFISGLIISRMLSAPIADLAKSAQAIGHGNLQAKVNVKGSQEIREVATAFNQMAADLQRSRKLRDTLMADVSHELRTPLTVLAGNLRAALDRVYDLDEAEIANLYGQTNHLIRLVNDLHELAQAAAHQLPLNLQPTAIPQLVSEAIQTFEALAKEQGVVLSSQLAPQLPLVLLDHDRILQVLHNLVSNALRHTSTGGSITVIAEANEQELLLLVVDTGEGIDPEHLENIFDRFYRVDLSRSRATGGTGLGLAIVKAIIEMHGGGVTVFSAGRGQGTSFKLWLPIRRVGTPVGKCG